MLEVQTGNSSFEGICSICICAVYNVLKTLSAVFSIISSKTTSFTLSVMCCMCRWLILAGNAEEWFTPLVQVCSWCDVSAARCFTELSSIECLLQVSDISFQHGSLLCLYTFRIVYHIRKCSSKYLSISISIYQSIYHLISWRCCV